ncbi:MAG: glycosyltransferase family 4 protein [Magnetococcus sp. DMHC-6]
MKILTFTSLYPNKEQPHHGIFVEQRLRHLLAMGGVESQVVAPVPWFPIRHSLFNNWSQAARVPLWEERHGTTIHHPRYPLIPKVNMTVAPLFMAFSVRGMIKELFQNEFPFDLIDAHYFYPDGVAAILLGQQLGVPVVITARGSDLNQIPNYYLPRKWIQWAASRASGLITVCQALKDTLIDMGIVPNHITVLRNGVDLKKFHLPPTPTTTIPHKKMRWTLLSVGHLIERKGHDLIIRAIREIPQADLLIVGEGEKKNELITLAQSLGVGDRVKMVGGVPQEELKRFYWSADALILASSREGWANVLLESMACGTPVIATPIWGTPEVVNSPDAGILTQDRSVKSLIEAIHQLMNHYPDPSATRRHAELFSWQETSLGQLNLFKQILTEHDALRAKN